MRSSRGESRQTVIFENRQRDSARQLEKDGGEKVLTATVTPLSEGVLTPTEAVTAAVSSASGNGGLAGSADQGPASREVP